MKLIRSLFVTIFFIALSSCQSGRMNGEDPLLVMVYDLENNTVKDVSVTVDGKELGRTDVYGRFVMTIPSRDTSVEHEVVVSKSGYSTATEKVTYSPSIVLYYKIGSCRQYMERAEKKMDKGELSGALKDVDIAVAIDPKEDSLYLRAVILGMMGDSDGAEEILSSLRENRNLIPYTGKEVSGYAE